MNVFISTNTNSAGTSNITKILLDEDTFDLEHDIVLLPDNVFFSAYSDSKAIIKLCWSGMFSGVKRLFYELFVLPKLVKSCRVSTVVIMANYSLRGFYCRKIVIMRHPYLVDRLAWKQIRSSKQYLTEVIRLIMFRLTLRSTDVIVVQTEAMKAMFLQKYGAFKGEVRVIGNPVSKSILSLRAQSPSSFDSRDRFIFYPSRYYSHKNHELILKLISEQADYFRENNLRFVVTLSENGEAMDLLGVLNTHLNADLVVNLGEVPQGDLVEYYKRSLMLFFPSQAETYGNPLVEAMCAGLPIVAADKPYAHALCGSSFIPFVNTAEAAVRAIDHCLSDWSSYSKRSIEKSKSLHSTTSWYHSILER